MSGSLLGRETGSAKWTIAASLAARQAVGVDVAELLERYRETCAASGIVPLPDAEAVPLLALVLACLDGDESGLELH